MVTKPFFRVCLYSLLSMICPEVTSIGLIRAYPVEPDTYQIWAVLTVAAKIIHYL